MLSNLHELLLQLFRNRPELAPELLREALHLELPRFTEARIHSADLTDVQPAEYRADLVVLLLDGVSVLGIVVESPVVARSSQALRLARLRCDIASTTGMSSVPVGSHGR